MKRITGIPSYTWELIAGIWVSALVFILLAHILVRMVPGIIDFFPKRGFSFDTKDISGGILAGSVTASLGALHMSHMLIRALDLPESAAVKKLATHNTLRYLCYGLLMGIAGYTGLFNDLGVFLGLLTIKGGAYLQPFMHRLVLRLAECESRGNR
ncbi:MAG: hypothetical protein IJU50_01720 [Lachnospiraceae bacterium]|nr:hypothetical protein [Lachnospiraceae bacterium]